MIEYAGLYNLGMILNDLKKLDLPHSYNTIRKYHAEGIIPGPDVIVSGRIRLYSKDAVDSLIDAVRVRFESGATKGGRPWLTGLDVC